MEGSHGSPKAQGMITDSPIVGGMVDSHLSRFQLQNLLLSEVCIAHDSHTLKEWGLKLRHSDLQVWIQGGDVGGAPSQLFFSYSEITGVVLEVKLKCYFGVMSIFSL